MADPSIHLTLDEALAILRKKGRIVGSKSEIGGVRTTDVDGVPRSDVEVYQMAEMEQGHLYREP